MIKEAIVKIVNKGDLTYDEAYAVMNEIMSGETSPTQNAAFLAALSTKSARAETKDEIAGCAAAMRDHATKVETDLPIFEIVGTGRQQFQYLYHFGSGCRFRRCESRQAWQPCGFLKMRHSGLSGGPGRQHRRNAGKMYRTAGHRRHVFLLRAEVSHFHEICRCHS